jgi:HK97 family phage prohead protease
VQHLTLKTEMVETEEELGVFEAIVSAWAEDRMGDTILPTAYDKTIAAWRKSGRWLPLLFEHSVKAIGEIDPESLAVDEEGLRVRGHVDQASEEGEQAWRQIKANTASFSIGFKSESRRRKGGKGREIYEIDLLEISFTSTPVNAAARVLGWKSMAGSPDLDSMTDAELKDYSLGLVDGIDKASRPITIATFEC